MFLKFYEIKEETKMNLQEKCCIILIILIFAINSNGAIKSMSIGNIETIIIGETENALLNPAGLSKVTKRNIALEFSPMMVGLDDGSIYKGNLYLTYPLKNLGAIGTSFEYLKAGTENIKSLYNEISLKFAFGYTLLEDLITGFTFKYNEWNVNASGFDINEIAVSKKYIDMDISINSFIKENIIGGIILLNVFNSKQEVKMDNNYNTRALKMGVRWGKGEKFLGIEVGYKDIIIMSLGGQTLWKDIYFRAGIQLNDFLYGINFTLGCGYNFHIRNLQINYALNYPVRFGIWGTHSIGINFNF